MNLFYTIFPLLLFPNHYVEAGLDYRLPENVKPLRYFLTMEPFLEDVNIYESTFTGSVTIELLVLKHTKNITMHSRNLTIIQESIRISTLNQSNAVASISFDSDREFFIVNFENELKQDHSYNLTIGEFFGELKQDLIGFYLAEYDNSEGEKSYMALTDFEPSDARKAFPCFDQPDLKAKFIISLIRRSGYNSISNEALDFSVNLENGRFKDTFKETVIMPTYTVAFIISDFSSIQEERVRIFARPQIIDGGNMTDALSVAREILKILENFTGVDYAMGKLDLFAVPNVHLASIAMENWGLLTYRENILLFSKNTSIPEDFKSGTTYITHELVHQWFGNLVTFKDWAYLWLSEGFAAYFQLYILSLYKPEWRTIDQLGLKTMLRLLLDDKVGKGQPLNYQPEKIGELPSTLNVYGKAADIIQMTDNFLTNDVFRRGLHIYLETHKFRAVEPLDLYNSYQEAVDESDQGKLLGGHSIVDILQTWDSNVGHPLVTVERNYETGEVTFTQKHYVSNGVGHDRTWYIPINIATNGSNFSDTTADFWLTQKTATIPNLSIDSWLLINKQQTGVYRINYDVTNWNLLAEFLATDEFGTMHVLNRAQLILNAFAFAKTGLIPYEIPLKLSKYVAKELDYVPIAVFVHSLSFLNTMMTSSPKYSLFQKYVLNALNLSYEHLGFHDKPQEAYMDRLNRENVLKWVCQMGNDDCAKFSGREFRRWKDSGEFSVASKFRSIIFCNAISNGSLEDWRYLYEETKKVPEEENFAYLKGLSCIKDEDFLTKFLETFLNISLISGNDRLLIRLITLSGSSGLNLSLKFLEDHPDMPEHLANFLFKDIYYNIANEEEVQKIKKFNETTHGKYKEAIEATIEATQSALDWVQNGYRRQIETWLVENQEN